MRHAFAVLALAFACVPMVRTLHPAQTVWYVVMSVLCLYTLRRLSCPRSVSTLPVLSAVETCYTMYGKRTRRSTPSRNVVLPR